MENYREAFLIEQIYATLFSLTNKLQVQGDKYFDKLTTRQLMAMVAIVHLQEDETTLNNIARKLGNTKQSTKQLITILENKGYVETVPSKMDKRAVNVKITDLGKQVTLECSKKSINFFADLSGDFTTEEMEILWLLLKKLYRFDGEVQDGFEKDAYLETGEDRVEILERNLKEFGKRRQEKINFKR